MTIFGHMKTINISTLKAKLSEALRDVRRGETYIVLDRDKPVAQILPYKWQDKLIISSAREKLRIPKVSFSKKIDPVEILIQDRQKR